jgi:hypothetical protein
VGDGVGFFCMDTSLHGLMTFKAACRIKLKMHCFIHLLAAAAAAAAAAELAT